MLCVGGILHYEQKNYKGVLESYFGCQPNPKYYCLSICVRNISFNFQYKFLSIILISPGKKGVLK